MRIKRNYILLGALSFLFLGSVTAQSPSNSAASTVSANIITGMIGAEKLNDINFSSIPANSSSATITAKASVNIIGDSFAHSISVFSTDITVKKNGSNEVVKINAFTIHPPLYSSDKEFAFNASLQMSDNTFAGHYTTSPVSFIISYD